MNDEPLDDLTLALIARRTPHLVLYAVGRHANTSMFQQHARCCAGERAYVNARFEYDYYYTDPQLVAPYAPDTTVCIVCKEPLE